MDKEVKENLESIAASCLLLVRRIKALEELSKQQANTIEQLSTQVLTLHQRSHTHAPMLGDYSGQIPSTPIDCLNVAR